MGRSGFVLWDVVEEHLDEAEFLWSQWERALVAPDFTLAEVAEREEERLLAHVDGLTAGGEEVAEKLLYPELAGDDPSRVSAAAFALFASGSPAAKKAAFAALRGGEEGPRAAICRALGLGAHPDASVGLLADLPADPQPVQAAILEALAFERQNVGPLLAPVTLDDDPAMVLAALRGARVGRERAFHRLIGEALGSEVAAIRDRALAAGLVLGVPGAWAACRRVAEEGGADAGQALLLVAIGGDARDQQAVIDAAAREELRGAALWAMGASGRVAAAEACLPLLHDPTFAAVAGEAFAAVTGLPVEGEMLAAEEKEADEPIPFAEEKLDASLIPGPEKALPRLDAGKVEAWWAKNRDRFDRRKRYLYGAPFGVEGVLEALERGPMRRRHVLALEVEIRSRGRLHLETRAMTARQRAELGTLRGMTAAELGRPFD
jgi:uncharacterized protein (TIGR02270 family)